MPVLHPSRQPRSSEDRLRWWVATNIWQQPNVINNLDSNKNKNNVTQIAHSSFSIFYQNCRGLNSKINEFSLSLLASDYDILALTETWLKPGVDSCELFGNYYIVFRCDRSSLNSSKQHGGGVLVAVKSKFSCDIISLPELHNLEIVIVKIAINDVNLFLICIYIPSNSTTSIYSNVTCAFF